MNRDFSFGQRMVLFLATYLGPVLLLLYGFTWRVKWEGSDNLAEAKKISDKVLYAFWHSRLIGLCYAHRFQQVGIMVSKSFDGEWISRLVTKIGISRIGQQGRISGPAGDAEEYARWRSGSYG